MTPKFNIGDLVYCAGWRSKPEYVTCPDCGGTGELTVVLYNEERLTIACRNCERGYSGSQGRVEYYHLEPEVRTGAVMGITVDGGPIEDPIEYRVQACDGKSGYSMYLESRVFATEQEALAKAVELTVLETEKNRKRALESKERDGSSWAWEVNYHRKQIRDAEKQIERSRVKLGYAKQQAAGERKPLPEVTKKGRSNGPNND